MVCFARQPQFVGIPAIIYLHTTSELATYDKCIQSRVSKKDVKGLPSDLVISCDLGPYLTMCRIIFGCVRQKT